MASHPGIVIRLLTWNLYHGRDAPPDPALRTLRSRLLRRTERGATHVQVNRSLRHEFAERLASWDWDVALLQEAPPRWREQLERATGGAAEAVLTSRNSLAPLRAALAECNPDLIASNEGGSNMLLVRPPARVIETRRLRLATRPERRQLLMTRLALPADPLQPSRERDPARPEPEPPGERTIVVACVHLSVPATGRGPAEAMRAAGEAVEWAAGDPVVLGGDLNLRPAQHRAAFDALADRYGLAPPTGPHSLDHLLARDLAGVDPPRALPPAARDVPGPDGLAIRLSDHAPVVAAFRL